MVFSRYHTAMNPHNIYNAVERLSELLRVDSRQAGAEHGLQPVQLEALHYLSICNQYSDTPMAVTQYLGQTKGTVSQTLKVLERKELLFRKADVNDKRISHLKVSNKGGELLKKTIPTNMFIKACELLSIQKSAEIETSLKVLLSALLQGNNMKTFGACHTCQHNIKVSGKFYCNLLKQPLSDDDVQLICKEHVDN